jgi:hypothetical protein
MKIVSVVLILSMMPCAATAAGLCERIKLEKLDQLFPEGAPWMQLGDGKMPSGFDIPGYEHCSFATDSQSSGNSFVDPQSPSISVTEIVMSSATDAEARVNNELETYRKNTSYDVQLTSQLGADAFRFELTSASGDVVVFTGHQANIFIQQWLHWPRKISQQDRGGAEQLMAIVLESAK